MSASAGGPRGRGRREARFGSCGVPGGGGGPGGGRYRRSVLEVAILASLAESTAHGYNLVDQIESLTGDLVCIDPGSMYRLLRTMEEEGLVTSSWQTPEAGPSRRVYVITARGIQALELMTQSLAQRAASMQRLANHAAAAVESLRNREKLTRIGNPLAVRSRTSS